VRAMVVLEAKDMADAKLKIAQYLALRMFSQSQENIVTMGITDQGLLLKSGSITMKPDGAEIVYAVDYAGYIEYGTKPHWAPFEPIKEWTKRKLGEDEDVAKAIWIKIAREGTDPQPYARDAIKMVIARYKS